MTISELLENFRKKFGNERDKGTAFEKLIKMYLEHEPAYTSMISKVWTWKEFPYRDNIGDTGIDLVAKLIMDNFGLYNVNFTMKIMKFLREILTHFLLLHQSISLLMAKKQNLIIGLLHLQLLTIIILQNKH